MLLVVAVGLLVILSPIITFFSILFGGNCYVYISKKVRGIEEPFTHEIWDPYRKLIATLLVAHGYVFHGRSRPFVSPDC